MYTDVNFAQGRGISIIASLEKIAAIKDMAVFKNKLGSKFNISREGAKKYNRKEVDGPKKQAIVANASFTKGELLLSLTPIIAVQEAINASVSKEDQSVLLRVATSRLPLAGQKLFFSQFFTEGADPFSDRIEKNSFNMPIGGSDQLFFIALPELAVSPGPNSSINVFLEC